MNAILDTLITTTVAEFCRISGMGHSKLYELLAAGTLASIKIGKRRLIVVDSYRKLIDEQCTPAPPRSVENQRRAPTSTAPPAPHSPRRPSRRRERTEMSP